MVNGDIFPATLLGWNDRYIEMATGRIRQVARILRRPRQVHIVHVDGTEAHYPDLYQLIILDRYNRARN